MLEALSETQFTYRLQGRKVIFSYASSPEQDHISDYRIADGHLILIDNRSILDEVIEVTAYHYPIRANEVG